MKNVTYPILPSGLTKNIDKQAKKMSPEKKKKRKQRVVNPVFFSHTTHDIATFVMKLAEKKFTTTRRSDYLANTSLRADVPVSSSFPPIHLPKCLPFNPHTSAPPLPPPFLILLHLTLSFLLTYLPTHPHYYSILPPNLSPLSPSVYPTSVTMFSLQEQEDKNTRRKQRKHWQGLTSELQAGGRSSAARRGKQWP